MQAVEFCDSVVTVITACARGGRGRGTKGHAQAVVSGTGVGRGRAQGQGSRRQDTNTDSSAQHTTASRLSLTAVAADVLGGSRANASRAPSSPRAAFTGAKGTRRRKVASRAGCVWRDKTGGSRHNAAKEVVVSTQHEQSCPLSCVWLLLAVAVDAVA